MRVALARDDVSVELVVTDTGDGIAKDFLPPVFERFRQADGATTRSHGGLGLSIVRHFVEMHGGAVSVASEGEGRGARFTVRLPGALHRAVTPGPRPAASATAPAALDGLRVLVVDDAEDTREMLRALLEGRGARVRLAASAAEALRHIADERPDVMLSDVGMPGEDGYALAAKVRALPPASGGDVPAAALTAYARAEDRARALHAGFDDHLSKPVEPAELFAVVAALAGRPRARLFVDRPARRGRKRLTRVRFGRAMRPHAPAPHPRPMTPERRPAGGPTLRLWPRYQPGSVEIGGGGTRLLLNMGGAFALLALLLSLPPVHRATGLPPARVGAVLGAYYLAMVFNDPVLHPAALRSRRGFDLQIAVLFFYNELFCLLVVVLPNQPWSPLWLAPALWAFKTGSWQQIDASVFGLVCHVVGPLLTIPVFLARGAPTAHAVIGPVFASVVCGLAYAMLSATSAAWRAVRDEREAELAGHRARAESLERERVARDLHDGFGSTLAITASYATVIRRFADRPEGSLTTGLVYFRAGREY